MKHKHECIVGWWTWHSICCRNTRFISTSTLFVEISLNALHVCY